MLKAVLLDLDNTLLVNPQEVFVPEYLRAVAGHFGEAFSVPLMRATRPLMGTRDMMTSNTDVILGELAGQTGRDAGLLRTEFEAFYRSDAYAQLVRCTQPVAGAGELLRWLGDERYMVVIATNPLYPAEAILRRLAWAGLPDTLDAYALVTHADAMRFVKPDPAYYAEILGHLGVEADEALMVGDSMDNDILPAQTVGLHTCFLESPSMERVRGFLQDTAGLTRRPLTPAMVLPELRGNVGALFGMLAEVKPHYWTQHPDPEEWSIVQILCHLRDTELTVQLGRLQRIMAEDNPFIAAPKPPPGPREMVCDGDGYTIAREFVAARCETLRWLEARRIEDWARPARHSIFGLTTLLEMAHFTAQHDRLHLNQLCRTLGKCE